MVSQGGQQAIKPFCEDNMTGSVSCGVSVDKEEEEERAVPLQFSYGDFTPFQAENGRLSNTVPK